MVCMGIEPRLAGWKVLTNPLAMVAPFIASFCAKIIFQTARANVIINIQHRVTLLCSNKTLY